MTDKNKEWKSVDGDPLEDMRKHMDELKKEKPYQPSVIVFTGKKSLETFEEIWGEVKNDNLRT